MLDRVRVTMPLDKPSTMSRQQIADVLSYIFSFNKIPAGKAELPRQAEMLNLIQYKARSRKRGSPPEAQRPSTRRFERVRPYRFRLRRKLQDPVSNFRFVASACTPNSQLCRFRLSTYTPTSRLPGPASNTPVT